MKFWLLGILALFSVIPTYAQNNQDVSATWTSADPRDLVTIENGTGARMYVQISVDGPNTAPGITVRNCGRTSRIAPGSVGICYTTDATNPVTFSSESTTVPAKGSYQIKLLSQ